MAINKEYEMSLSEDIILDQQQRRTYNNTTTNNNTNNNNPKIQYGSVDYVE